MAHRTCFVCSSFDHSLPKRYVKEFVRGVDKNHDHFLEKEDFLSFLNAIGASDKLTSEDLDEALHEILANASMPNDSCRLPDDVMESIMLDGIRREEM